MKRIATVRTIVARSLIAIVSAASLVVAQPAYALSGLVHDSDTTETSTSLTKGLTVSCPPGKKVLSGGADIDQVSEGGRIIGLEPDTDNGAWFRADAAVEPGLSGKVPWSLTVHIICADPPAGGLHYTKVTTRPNREATQWVRPYCGAGEKLVGFGGRVATDTKPRNVALTAVLPDIDLKNLLVHGIEMEAGEDRDWSVTAYTVCAQAGDGLVSELDSWGLPDSQAQKVVSVGCSGGKQLHAIGGVTYGGFGHVAINRLHPSSLLAGDMSSAEDRNGALKAWSMYAVGKR